MKFAEYLLDRDEEMAFYVLEQDLQNEGLVRGLRGIWNITRGKKYNQQDAKSAMNTSNLIANIPDALGAGRGIMNILRTLALSGASLAGGDHQPIPTTPVIQAAPSHQYQHGQEDDAKSYDIYRGARAGRDAIKMAQGYAKMSAFDDAKRKKGTLDFIDQTPSV